MSYSLLDGGGPNHLQVFKIVHRPIRGAGDPPNNLLRVAAAKTAYLGVFNPLTARRRRSGKPDHGRRCGVKAWHRGMLLRDNEGGHASLLSVGASVSGGSAMAAGERALIVGAGAGLSAAIARRCAGDGMSVVLAARDTQKLGDLARETGAAV